MIYLGRMTFPWPSIYIGLAIATIVLFVYQMAKSPKPDQNPSKAAFILTTIGAVTPILLLLLAIMAFTIGCSHPTAQLSGQSDWWGIWISLWFPAIIMHGVSLLLVLISFILEHSPIKHKAAFYYQVVTLAFILVSTFCVFGNFPDA